jgi:photosystem II stability/assembly factor-like uncharacterized protein
MFPKLKQIPGVFLLLCFTLTVAAQVDPTSAADRLTGLEKRKTLEKASTLNHIAFKNIGPSIMSGRVSDLEVNNDDPTEFYVAYASGGLWHTTNNGQSFTPIFDSENVLTIGDIAVDWSNTRTIWIGTGEVNSSRSSYAGTGIYKSSDNGKTWQYMGLPESHHIGKIQLHPTNPSIAWVAALGHLYSPNKDRGVYKTTDGGKTWKQTLFVNDNTGAVDLDINPSNPNEVYAGMWYRVRRAWKFEESGKSSGIYKSTDGGETWKLVSGPGSGFMQGEKIGRIGIAVFPKDPKIVWAVVDNNNPKPDTSGKKVDTFYTKEMFKDLTKEDFALLKSHLLDTFLRKNNFPRKYTARNVKEMVAAEKVKSTALWDYLDTDDGFQNTGIYGCEVYKSTDGGITWKKSHDKPISIFNTYGYYFAKIYTSHYNPDMVYILGFYAQISDDGGKTFRTMDKGNVHADHHALWVNPKKDLHLINGNDGGVNITYDSGRVWHKANMPPVGQYYAITLDDAKPYNVYGGMQDNGSWWGPSNHKEDIGWVDNGQYAYRSINGGDGMQAQVDTRDNATVYSGWQFGVYSRYNKERRGAQKFLRPQHELGEKPLRFNWQSPILLSKHNQDVFYIGGNRLYRSLNKGDTLIAMSNDLSKGGIKGNVPYGTLTTLAESPLRFGLLYAGTDDGNIHLTRDGGYTWEQLNHVEPAVKAKTKTTSTRLNTNQLWVSRVSPSQHAVGRIYVTLNGYRYDNFAPYVYVSEDFGATWKQLGTDLPMEPVNVIREDPKNPNILYVGTDGGLYVSFNRGSSFMMWNAGLPKSVPVHDIAIHQRDNEIVLGTHGRSLYVASLENVQKKEAE